MIDAKNNTLQVGDFVVYVSNANTNPHIETGHIQKIYANQKACTINSQPNIRPSRILKVDSLKDR